MELSPLGTFKEETRLECELHSVCCYQKGVRCTSSLQNTFVSYFQIRMVTMHGGFQAISTIFLGEEQGAGKERWY